MALLLVLRAGLSLLALLCSTLAAPVHACWDEAGRRHGVSPHLLYAIARVESSLQPGAMNRSHLARTGTYDIGLMQINSGHLRTLARHGIAERDLIEPCTNIDVAAWLLADLFARHGVTWEAVGAYNAACAQLRGTQCQAARSRYAWKVYRQLSRHAAAAPTVVPAPVPLAMAGMTAVAEGSR
jgi:soluble lytic murein transglycosylase-like protein